MIMRVAVINGSFGIWGSLRLFCINMSAKNLLEMTQCWYDCKQELERTQATLQIKEKNNS